MPITHWLIWLAVVQAGGDPLPDLSGYRARAPFLDPLALVEPPAAPKQPEEPPAVRFVISDAIRAALLREVKTAVGEQKPRFQVQIYAGASAEAHAARLDFMQLYPEYDVVLIYDKPVFKVRVGAFPLQEQADQLARDVKSKFPMAFVAPYQAEGRN